MKECKGEEWEVKGGKCRVKKEREAGEGRGMREMGEG